MLNPPPAAEDPAVLRAERRLRLLGELAEIGVELARALKAAAEAAPAQEADRPKGRDPAEVFGPLSRAIRLTLEATTDADLSDLKAGVIREREKEEAQATENARVADAEQRDARIDRIRELVLTVAEAEIEDSRAYEDLWESLDDRLMFNEDELACAERALRQTVEGLCRELGLSPDWSRWTGEGWIDDGPIRPRSSPLNGASAELAPSPSPHLAHDLE